ncbi:MAG: response regulator [Calditrichaeota bacterium]|nr:MAG: response regulator [Calditrichota bacterium]
MKKILIVDDEPFVQEMLSDFLQMIGYDTCTALNGKEGLEKVKSEKPDLILVDLEMPVMNGVAFCEALFEKHPDYPVFIVSAWLNKYDPQALLSMGVREILQKPIAFDDLKEAIESHLS